MLSTCTCHVYFIVLLLLSIDDCALSDLGVSDLPQANQQSHNEPSTSNERTMSEDSQPNVDAPLTSSYADAQEEDERFEAREYLLLDDDDDDLVEEAVVTEEGDAEVEDDDAEADGEEEADDALLEELYDRISRLETKQDVSKLVDDFPKQIAEHLKSFYESVSVELLWKELPYV